MKYASLILAVFLVGCSTPVPVKQKFPDVPKASRTLRKPQKD